jgi:hypothetical protein
MSSGHHRFLPVLLLAAEATKSRLKSSAGSQYAAVHSLACCYSEDETPLMQVSTEVDNALAHLPCRIHVAHLITAHLVTSKIISHVSTAPSIPDSTHNVYCLGTSGLVLKHYLIPYRKLSASATPAAVLVRKVTRLQDEERTRCSRCMARMASAGGLPF